MLSIKNSNLSTDEKEQIEACILAVDDVFALNDSECGKVKAVQHTIDTAGQSMPVHQPP